MRPTLLRELTLLASSTVKAETTLSQYFTIDSIKVRLSDHDSTSKDYDLAIYETGPGYTAIPNIGTFKEVRYFSNIPDLLDYVKNFAYFAKVLVKPILSNPVHQEHQREILQEKKESVKTEIKLPMNTITTAMWKSKLGGLCSQKKPYLIPLLEEIFSLIPNEKFDETVAHVKAYSGYNAEGRFTCLQNYLNTLKDEKNN